MSYRVPQRTDEQQNTGKRESETTWRSTTRTRDLVQTSKPIYLAPAAPAGSPTCQHRPSAASLRSQSNLSQCRCAPSRAHASRVLAQTGVCCDARPLLFLLAGTLLRVLTFPFVLIYYASTVVSSPAPIHAPFLLYTSPRLHGHHSPHRSRSHARLCLFSHLKCG